MAFSGSAIKQGERHAVVYATGANTFFGRAANLIGSTHNVANIQKVSFKTLVKAVGRSAKLQNHTRATYNVPILWRCGSVHQRSTGGSGD